MLSLLCFLYFVMSQEVRMLDCSQIHDQAIKRVHWEDKKKQDSCSLAGVAKIDMHTRQSLSNTQVSDSFNEKSRLERHFCVGLGGSSLFQNDASFYKVWTFFALFLSIFIKMSQNFAGLMCIRVMTKIFKYAGYGKRQTF